jgi:protein subunit release factor A
MRTYNYKTNTIIDHKTNKTISVKEFFKGKIDLLK